MALPQAKPPESKPPAPPAAPPAPPAPAPMLAPPPAAPPMQGAPPAAGTITCPHCGAPVKFAADPTMAPPVAPPMAMAPPAPVAPPVPPAPTPAPMDSEGGDADAIKELDKLSEALGEKSTNAGGDPSIADTSAAVLAEGSTGTDGPSITATKEAVLDEQPQTPSISAAEMDALREEARQLKEALQESQTALAESTKQLNLSKVASKRELAEKVIDIGLRSGRLTKKLIGTLEKPGWARAEAHRDPRAFSEWLKAAPKLWEPGARGVGMVPDGGQAVAFAERMNGMVRKAMDGDKSLNYTDATKRVLRENPALAEDYDRSINDGVANREVKAESADTAVS